MLTIFQAIPGGKCVRASTTMIFVAAITVWSEHCVKAEIYPSIYWTPHNPIFSNSKNELKAFLHNRIHIVCPNPSTVLATMKDPTSINNLYENIWNVDETSYRTCSARKAVNRTSFLICDRPSKLHYTTIVFKMHQPGSSEMVFRPGKDYFFIATSDGTRKSLNSTFGGHCLSHNMRFRVYVCRNKQDARCNPSKEYNTQRRTKTVAEEESVVPPSTSISFDEGNQTEALPNLCNNSAFGTKGETENYQRSNSFVWPIAILTSVAVLSIALNAVQLWKRFKDQQNTQCDPSRLSINLPS